MYNRCKEWHDGWYPSGRTSLCRTWQGHTSGPKLLVTQVRNEVEGVNKVSGQVVGRFQRVILSVSALMPGRVDLAIILNSRVPEMLEAYRHLVSQASIPYLVPARHVKAPTDRVLAESHPTDSIGEQASQKHQNKPNLFPTRDVMGALYGATPLETLRVLIHLGVAAWLACATKVGLKNEVQV